MNESAQIPWQTWVVVAAVILFYLRLIQIRGKRMRERRAHELEMAKAKGRKTPPPQGPQVTYQVASWWLLGIGGLAMLAGLALRYGDFPLADLKYWWWLFISGGVFLFMFGLK